MEPNKKSGNFLIQPFTSPFKNLWFAAIVLCFSQAIVSTLSVPNLHNTLKLQFMMTPEAVSNFVQSWSVEEWAGFWRHYKWDFIHPIVYAYCFLVFAANLGFERKRLFNFRILVIAAAIFDYLENIFHILGLRNQTQIAERLVVYGGFFAYLKWMLICFLVGLLFLHFLRKKQLKNG